MKVKLEKKIEGFEEWAEYREAEKGDKYYLDGSVFKVGCLENGFHKLILTPEKPKRWRADGGDNYWLLNSCLQETWSLDVLSDLDNERYKSGNYFKTKEEAQAFANHCKGYFEG